MPVHNHVAPVAVSPPPRQQNATTNITKRHNDVRYKQLETGEWQLVDEPPPPRNDLQRAYFTWRVVASRPFALGCSAAVWLRHRARVSE